MKVWNEIRTGGRAEERGTHMAGLGEAGHAHGAAVERQGTHGWTGG